MINNRSNGRRRGRGSGGQRPQGGSGGSGQRDSGNRIDSRARGNASQLYEKYKNMASDAQRQGDRVNTEYYLQFADHYFRVMADQRGRYEDQNQPRRGRDDFDGDEEYGDEGEPIRGDELSRPADSEQQRDSQQRDYQSRDNGARDGGQRDYQQRDASQRDGNQRDYGQRDSGQREYQQRDGGQQNNGQRDYAPRDNIQREGGQRDNSQRGTGQRDGGQRYEGKRSGGYDRAGGEPRREERSQNGAEPRATVPSAMPSFANDQQVATQPETPASEPKRRGRPRKALIEATAGSVNDAPTFDSSVLPPSLGVSADTGDDKPAPKPRRRRSTAGEASQAS